MNTPKLRFKEFSGEWEVKKLGQVIDSTKKWSFTGGPFGSNLKAEDYTDDGVRIIQLQNIGDGVFNDDYKIYTSEEKANQLLSCNIYPNEIIISKMGDPVARCCIMPTSASRFLMASDGIRLVVDKVRFNTKFIHDVINAENFRKNALEASTGSTRRRIGLDDLRQLPVTHPTLPEQTKIANFLTAIDEKIAQLSQTAQLLTDYKKGVMQQIFSQQLRFKDDDGREFDEWKEKKIIDIATIIGGGTPDTTVPDYWNGDVQWFTPTELKSKYTQKSLRTITQKGLKDSSAKILPIGALLLSSRATVGDVSIALTECTTNQGFQSLVVNNQNSNQFVYYWISNNKNLFLEKSSGSTFLEISKKEIEKLKINIPSLPEQTKIANFLTAIDDKITQTKDQLEAMKLYKKGLLQQMFV